MNGFPNSIGLVTNGDTFSNRFDTPLRLDIPDNGECLLHIRYGGSGSLHNDLDCRTGYILPNDSLHIVCDGISSLVTEGAI